MSSRNKEMQARTEGMAYALRIAKEKGIEELEKEIKFRNLTGISLNLSRKDLNTASEKIKEMTMDTFTILTVAVLHDEFGFGERRCQRFIDRMNQKAECMIDDFCTWDDYIQTIKEELNLELQIRWNKCRQTVVFKNDDKHFPGLPTVRIRIWESVPCSNV